MRKTQKKPPRVGVRGIETGIEGSPQGRKDKKEGIFRRESVCYSRDDNVGEKKQGLKKYLTSQGGGEEGEAKKEGFPNW